MADRLRRGLVLGAGGTLGATWMVARLRALERELGFDARDVELAVGSSAGSVLAALLTSGVSVADLLDHQHGRPAPNNPLAQVSFHYDTGVGGALPERPPLRLGSPALLRRVARHPRRLGAMTALAAALPPGRGSLGGLRAAVQRAAGGPDAPWPQALRVTALDYVTGERVTFGAPGAPTASVADAVLASCSIPGWFAPAVIDGRRYVDVGIRQATSADLAAGHGLDEVIVLAPLATVSDQDVPDRRFARLERSWRRHLTRTLRAEVAALDRDGVRTLVVTPTVDERVAMGPNLMDSRRRARVLDAADPHVGEPVPEPPGLAPTPPNPVDGVPPAAASG